MSTPEQTPAPQAPKRQYVNFAFYKIDPAWRRLPESERTKGKQEFLRAVEDYGGKVLVVAYSSVGIRGDCDIMLWRISYELELFQDMTTKMLASGLGQYLTTPYSYLSITKRSVYVDHHTHQNQESKRLTVVPGRAKYIFIYPFLKTREWFLLTKAARQGMMDEHIEVGHRFPSVKLNTTYSFGLDDQEWVVAFESDKPEDFLDLVMALRETEGSRYTLRGCTPIPLLMMNSRRARPTPALGNCANSNASSGLPTFIAIFTAMRGISPRSRLETSNGNNPSNTLPVSPSAQETVTGWPSFSRAVASPQPTTAGMPSSRAMIAAWQVRPPRFVTMAAASFMTGSQFGLVMSVTSTSPGLTFAIWEASGTTRTAPLPILWPIARPLARTRELPLRA